MGGPGSGPKKGQKWHGAPTKLTKKLSDDIVKLVEAGNYLETAAGCCGVSPQTARAWLKKGANADKRGGIYARFLTAYKRAEGRAEATAVVRIRQAAAKQWQAEAWYLERKFPAKWGRWQRPEAEGEQISSDEYVLTLRKREPTE